MKRLLLPLLLFAFAGAIAQPPSSKYTPIQMRTNQIGEYFRDINLPVRGAHDTTATSGQWPYSGMTLIDTVNHILYFKSGDQHWHAAGSGSGGSFGKSGGDTAQAEVRSFDQAGYRFKIKNANYDIGAYDSLPLRIDYPWNTAPISSTVWPTITGTTVTASGSNTRLNGTITLTNALKTGVENGTFEVDVITNVKSNIKQALSVAIISDTLSALTTRKITWNFTDTTTRYISFFMNDGGTVPVASTQSGSPLSWSAADTMHLFFQFRKGFINASATNKRTGQQIPFAYNIGYSPGNIGSIKIINEGDFTYVGNFTYKIDEISRPDYLFVGSSIYQGAGATAPAYRWESTAMPNGTSYVVTAGGGERSISLIARMDEIKFIGPRKVIGGDLVNDVNGGSLALASQYQRRFADTLAANGIQYVIASTIPQATNVQTANDTLTSIATNKGLRYIDVTTALQAGSGDFNKNNLYKPVSDAIHVNDLGQAVQGNTIKNKLIGWGLITRRKPFDFENIATALSYQYLMGKDFFGNAVWVSDGTSPYYIKDNFVANGLGVGESKSIGISGQFTHSGTGGTTDFFQVYGAGGAGNPYLKVNSAGVSLGPTVASSLSVSNFSSASGVSTFSTGNVFFSNTQNLATTPFVIMANNPAGNGIKNILTVDNNTTTYNDTIQRWRNFGTTRAYIFNDGAFRTVKASGYLTAYDYSSLGNFDWPTKRHLDSLILTIGGGRKVDTLYNNGTSDSLIFTVNSTRYAIKWQGSGGSGVTAMAAFGSTPNANGGTISGSNLTLQPADGTNPGGLSITTQTIAGAKTFATSINTTSGKYLANSVQAIYLVPTFTNTSIFGDGGAALSHTSGNQGYYNTFVGLSTGTAATTGSMNVGVGSRVMNGVLTGTNNTSVGEVSMNAVTSGSSNTALGAQALTVLTTASNNTAIGYLALSNIVTTGNSNTALGYQAGGGNTTGINNQYIGFQAGVSNQSGAGNTYIGYTAGAGVSTNSNSNNTGIGYQALNAVTTGGTNISIGYKAGDAITSGSNNVIIGSDVDAPTATSSNQLVIANLIFGTGASGTGTTPAGSVGIAVAAPTARLMLPAGTTAASSSPFKFTSGTNMTAAEAGAVEWDGTNLFITQTTGPTRKTIAYTTDVPTASTGLTNTAGTWTNDLSTGKAGGQTQVFGTAANDQGLIRGSNVASGSTTTNPDITFIAGDGAGLTAMQVIKNGTIKTRFLTGTTSIGTITAGTGAGTSPTVSVTGTDIGGTINVTTGTLPTLAAAVATINFGNTYPSAPRAIVLTPANINSAALSGVTMVYIDVANITTGAFVITAGATALAAATSYKWFYTILL